MEIKYRTCLTGPFSFKLKIYLYLSWNNYKVNAIFDILTFIKNSTIFCYIEYSVDTDQQASDLDLHCFQLRFYLVSYCSLKCLFRVSAK